MFQKILPFQKGLPFPKGIIKEKTKKIYDEIYRSQFFDLSYYYVGFMVFDNKFMIVSGIYSPDNRHKLFDRENERRVSFGIKENYNFRPKEYSKVYQSY